MPTYTVEDPKTGRSVELTGDSEPTEQELEQVFADMANQEQSQAAMAGIEGAIGATPQGAALMRYAPAVAGMGIEAGLTTAGQSLGAMPALSVPTRGLSVPVLGAAGAALGYEAARRLEGRPFELGRFGTTVAAGAVPTGPVAKQTIKQLIGTGAMQGAANVGLANVQSLIDRGQPLSMGENALAFGTGAASPAIAKGVGKVLGGKAVKAPLTEQEQMAKKAVPIFAEAQKRGLKIAPSELGRGVGVETFVAGKETTDNIISAQNAGKFQKMARNDIGLSPTADAITEVEIKTQRETFEAPFEAAKNVSPEARDMVDSITFNRAKARRLYNQVKANAPGAHEQWLQVKDEIRAGEQLLEQELEAKGKKDLANAIKEGRVGLAKIGAIQDTYNKSTGVIDPQEIRRLYNQDRSENSLTGELKLIADFANSFENAAKPVGFSPVNQMRGSPHYAATQISGGSPKGMFAAFLENTAGKAVRPMMLREGRQRKLLIPRYQPEVVGSPEATFTRLGVSTVGRNEAASQ